MNLSIKHNESYIDPVKIVLKDDVIVGCVFPICNALVYTSGNNLNTINDFFKDNDQALIYTIKTINRYRKAFGYDALYIDKLSNGIANIRGDSFWKSQGFVQDANPCLMYLNN